MFGDGWFHVNDGDPRLVSLYQRHYSARLGTDNRRGIAGPGERLCLLTGDSMAGWVWRLYRVTGEPSARDPVGDISTRYAYEGVCCSFFRNEGPKLSSQLIREAVDLGRARWPGEQRMFTFIAPAKIRSVNPGYCFKMAGWRKAGVTKGGLDILETVAC